MKTRRLLWLAVLLTVLCCQCASVVEKPVPQETVRQSVANQFLDEVQERTFQYFWDLANPRTKLIPDRYPTPSFSSIAAVGFALTVYPAGVERGYITREQARERVLNILEFFANAPSNAETENVTGYQGFFYHFLNMDTGYRYQDVELSTIDTTLLFAGALFCQSYFDGQHPSEKLIRQRAETLYRRANWKWFQIRKPSISMGWRPENGFIDADWHGYNEAMILLVLALASPTYPVEKEVWNEFTSTYQWGEFYGQEYVGFAPLFGHHYSHVWIDFEGIQDSYMRQQGIDYFENSRRATYAQRDYAMHNPMSWKDYGENIWGLSACDGPLNIVLPVNGIPRHFSTYMARGAAHDEVRDDGTISPAAAAGSMPFTPEISLPALMEMRRRYGKDLFAQYGFLDAFNPTFTFNVKVQHGRVIPGKGWFDSDYIGIDQGVLFTMIENYRSKFIWKVMKKNPHIIRGLRHAGFTGGWLDEKPEDESESRVVNAVQDLRILQESANW
jgi:hypothetical protein